MSPNSYDVIVIGVGGVGSATVYELAKRGLRVLGIDRFASGHDRGSSHGETRAIRKAYFEHPDYVPLLLRAYDNWKQLESESGRRLLYPTGILEVGPADGMLLEGVRQAASDYHLDLEEITHKDFQQRFPGFVLPEGSEAVFEPDGGFLLVEECVRTYMQLASGLGARLEIGQSVKSWSCSDRRVEVRCERETFTAERLVVTAGAWAADLLKQIGVEFRVLRKHLHWYAANPGAYQLDNHSPVFFYETDQGCYYGFPSLDQRTIKVAQHTGGERVEDPLNCQRDVDPRERSEVEEFLESHLKEVSMQPEQHAVCMYTMTADAHFVVDRVRGFDNVVFAAGLSGHGYKFASVLGEILADLAEGKLPKCPIDFLAADRKSLRK